MARLAALRLLLRRERAEFGAIVLVTLLVAFTAFISAAGMRLFERAADDGLRASVAAAPVAQRTIQLTSTRLVLPPDTAAQTVDLQAEGRELGAGFPEAVRELIGTENLAVSSVRMRVTNPPEYPVYVTLRYQDRVDDVVDLVGGRWPAATGDQLPAVAEFREQTGGLPGWPSATNHYSDPLRHFEVALRDTTAQHLGLSVGSTMRIDVDLVDPMFASSILRPADVVLAPTELLVTGLYSVPDPDSDAWFGDPRLISDDVGEASDEPTAYINAYVPPDAVPGLLSSGLPFEYRWRYPIELSRLDADTVAHTAQGFRIMESRTVGSTEGPDITAEAGLLSLLERHTGLRSAS